MISTKTKQSTVFGTLMTIAIALITFGVSYLNTNIEQWYVGLSIIAVGLVMIIIDTYVLKSQENC